MKLHFNPASPFVRMARVAAHEAGLADQIEIVPTGAVSPIEVHQRLAADNPLGKMPCLVTDHGHALYDARVICEYLAHRGGHAGLFPDEPVKRFRVLTIQALAHGIADAAVLYRYETVMRPEALRWEAFAERQLKRIDAGLDALEGRWAGDLAEVTAGSVAAACALSYLDFRFADRPWRDTRPRLAACYEAFAKRPSMLASELANPT
ncbi:MAG TPA: glutathione S-transferase [Aestuariivirgaceae bacterium]|nr:glutathione S-transferase [Aestuariivirgaceae bacterium]